MKRLLAAVLGASVVCGASVPALAADTALDTAQSEPELQMERVLAYGTIVSMDKGTTFPAQMLIRCSTENDGEILLNLDASTILLDSGTGKPGNWEDLKVGDSVYVFHSPAMTKSLPPQTYAEAIVYNVPADMGCAMLHTVETIETTDQGTSFLTDQGSLYIHTGPDTVVSRLSSTEPAALDDIQKGDRVFAWYNGVMQSYPGQAYASKLVVIPAESAVSQKPESYTIVLEHDMVLPQKAVWKDGVLMVPMRAVAEALGCTVTWEEASQSATMANPTRTMTITIGEDLYVSEAAPETGLVGMTSPVALGCAPYTDAESRTWIPAKAFEVMVGFTVALDDANGSVEIHPA